MSKDPSDQLIAYFYQVLFQLLYNNLRCCSVTQLCSIVCDPMDCSTPGFPVLHHLLEFAQTHVHRVGDAIQSSHPLSSPVLPPSIFPSIRVFSNQSAFCIRWPKSTIFEERETELKRKALIRLPSSSADTLLGMEGLNPPLNCSRLRDE